jgi:hypothetical protein
MFHGSSLEQRGYTCPDNQNGMYSLKPIKMLEFSICSLQLSCMPLMAMPGVWKRQWCQATIPSAMQQNVSTMEERTSFDIGGSGILTSLHRRGDNPDDTCFAFEHPTLGAPSLRMDDGSSLRSACHLHVKSKVHLLKLQSFLEASSL